MQQHNQQNQQEYSASWQYAGDVFYWGFEVLRLGVEVSGEVICALLEILCCVGI
jgi:hypothetical protein